MTGLNKLLLNKHFWSFVLLAILVVCLFMNYLKPDLQNLINKLLYPGKNRKASPKRLSSEEHIENNLFVYIIQKISLHHGKGIHIGKKGMPVIPILCMHIKNLLIRAL